MRRWHLRCATGGDNDPHEGQRHLSKHCDGGWCAHTPPTNRAAVREAAAPTKSTEKIETTLRRRHLRCGMGGDDDPHEGRRHLPKYCDGRWCAYTSPTKRELMREASARTRAWTKIKTRPRRRHSRCARGADRNPNEGQSHLPKYCDGGRWGRGAAVAISG